MVIRRSALPPFKLSTINVQILWYRYHFMVINQHLLVLLADNTSLRQRCQHEAVSQGFHHLYGESACLVRIDTSNGFAARLVSCFGGTVAVCTTCRRPDQHLTGPHLNRPSAHCPNNTQKPSMNKTAWMKNFANSRQTCSAATPRLTCGLCG